MYHKPSKRQEIIQRTVTYSIMSIAVVGLVTALVFVMLGYQFDQTHRRIEQGGLVQFASQPTGATVSIDGTAFGTRTSSKTTLGSGQHFVTMQRNGYKQWQKSVNVVPGSILWLNYARLIPNELKPANVASFKGVSSTSVSPDTKWMAVTEATAEPTVRLADLSQDTVKVKNLELPAESYTAPAEGKTQSFELIKWDSGSRYILAKHVYDDVKLEWLVIDTQDSKNSQNITKLLDIDASKVVFSGNNSNILYAQIGADVRRIDIDAATLSRPLASNVAEFSVYDDTSIIYTSLPDPTTKERSAGYYDEGADKVHTIRSYTDDGTPRLKLAIGEYFNDTYVAIAHGDKIEVLKGDPSMPDKLHSLKTLTLTGGAQYLSIVTEGRFIVAQNGATFATYDLELKKATTTKLKGTAEVTSELHWLDEYTVWSDRDNILRLYEFDGANQHDIMPVTPGFSVTLSPNAKYLYGMIKSNDGTFHLERVRMILP